MGSGPTSTSGGFTRAFLREGHGWVAALAAVASVVVSVIFATGGGSSGTPAGTATATASPTPYLATATATASGAVSPSAGASSEISAACVGCTDAERTTRQSALDTLSTRLAAITDES